ncbi:hypothetical protein BH09BAC2_BH09BAC2_24090 [soil metagenome]
MLGLKLIKGKEDKKIKLCKSPAIHFYFDLFTIFVWYNIL